MFNIYADLFPSRPACAHDVLYRGCSIISRIPFKRILDKLLVHSRWSHEETYEPIVYAPLFLQNDCDMFPMKLFFPGIWWVFSREHSVDLTLSANPTQWANTIKQFVGRKPTNCLSVFDHFVGLALKGLTQFLPMFPSFWYLEGIIYLVRLQNFPKN